MTEQEACELWEERAAIREYEGGFGRERAEYLAAMDLKRILGVIPDSVLLMVLPDGPVRNMIELRNS